MAYRQLAREQWVSGKLVLLSSDPAPVRGARPEQTTDQGAWQAGVGAGAGALEAWPQAGEFHTRSQPTNISSSQSGRWLPAESLPPHQSAALSQTDLPLTQGEAPQPLQLEPDPTPAQVTAKLKDFLGIRLHLPAKQQQQWGCSPEPSCPERFPPTPGTPHQGGVKGGWPRRIWG